jgi:hypothetical protein
MHTSTGMHTRGNRVPGTWVSGYRTTATKQGVRSFRHILPLLQSARCLCCFRMNHSASQTSIPDLDKRSSGIFPRNRSHDSLEDYGDASRCGSSPLKGTRRGSLRHSWEDNSSMLSDLNKPWNARSSTSSSPIAGLKGKREKNLIEDEKKSKSGGSSPIGALKSLFSRSKG